MNNQVFPHKIINILNIYSRIDNLRQSFEMDFLSELLFQDLKSDLHFWMTSKFPILHLRSITWNSVKNELQNVRVC